MTSIINVTAVDCKVLFPVINSNDFTYIRKNVSKKINKTLNNEKHKTCFTGK